MVARRTSVRLRLGALADVLRSISASAMAAVVAGVLVGGVGGRLAMRVAALADPDATGTITETGNMVGEMTAGGSTEVVIFGGLLTGLLAGVIWALVKPWALPLGKWRSFFGGVLAVATIAFTVVAANKVDLGRLAPSWLNLGIFLALFFAAGVVMVELDDWLERRLPQPMGASLILYGLVAVGLAVVGYLAAPAFFSAEACECLRPPQITGGFLGLAGLATVFFWVLAVAQGAEPEPPRWMRALGNIGLFGATIAGLIHIWPEVQDILG
jgi:hypothetical protein